MLRVPILGVVMNAAAVARMARKERTLNWNIVAILGRVKMGRKLVIIKSLGHSQKVGGGTEEVVIIISIEQ